MDRRQDRQFLVFAVVILGVTGVAAGRAPGIDRLEGVMGQALTPVQRAITGLGDQLTSVLSGAHTLQALRLRTSQLETQNAALQTDLLKVNDLKRENRKLRDLAGFGRQRVDLDLVGASLTGRVAAEDPGGIRRILRLDVGTDQGVAPHQAVADDRGLVGQVLDASQAWSDVLLIVDPDSRVEGRIERSGATGIVLGTPTGDLVMRYIPQNSTDSPPTVEVGDLVLTSGLSERFPPKLLIGQVLEVHQSDVETHQEALIRPSVDFNALELVLVVRDWRPTPADTARDGQAPTTAGGATP
jgi:rod shape-determining protein MreC